MLVEHISGGFSRAIRLQQFAENEACCATVNVKECFIFLFETLTRHRHLRCFNCHAIKRKRLQIEFCNEVQLVSPAHFSSWVEKPLNPFQVRCPNKLFSFTSSSAFTLCDETNLFECLMDHNNVQKRFEWIFSALCSQLFFANFVQWKNKSIEKIV